MAKTIKIKDAKVSKAGHIHYIQIPKALIDSEIIRHKEVYNKVILVKE